MLPDGSRTICMNIERTCFLSWICTTYADPAQQPITTAGEELLIYDLDHDLFEACRVFLGPRRDDPYCPCGRYNGVLLPPDSCDNMPRCISGCLFYFILVMQCKLSPSALPVLARLCILVHCLNPTFLPSTGTYAAV